MVAYDAFCLKCCYHHQRLMFPWQPGEVSRHELNAGKELWSEKLCIWIFWLQLSPLPSQLLYKINTQKSLVFLYTNNEKTESAKFYKWGVESTQRFSDLYRSHPLNEQQRQKKLERLLFPIWNLLTLLTPCSDLGAGGFQRSVNFLEQCLAVKHRGLDSLDFSSSRMQARFAI